MSCANIFPRTLSSQLSKRSCLAAILILTGSHVKAEVRLTPLFGDNMVLQRDVSANIWGEATPNEVISVTIDKQSVQAKTGADGRWRAKLPPQKAGGPFDITVTGENTITLKDVYFGDVWLIAGQSNMEWTNKSILKPEVFEVESAAANDPQMRVFTVKKNPQIAPATQVSGEWQAITPKSMANFSATGYFFGRELRQKLGVPIGIIGSYWGGMEAQPFISVETMTQNFPDLKANLEKCFADFPAEKLQYEEVKLPKWRADVEKAKAEGRRIPGRPKMPLGAPESPERIGALFNGMIAPLIPLSLKGIAWYQGESNGDNLQEALEYKTIFPLLITDWRARWGQELPFIWVQLANYRQWQEQPVEPKQAWPYVREAQTLALSLPSTGMALALGNDDPTAIHPTNKIAIGKRLADVALGVVYGQKIPYTGPLFDTMQIEGAAARIHFKHADGGLRADGETVKGFAIAGADGKFLWADARIEGESVILSSSQIQKPVAVRYSWADNPVGNLFNGAGLPASPFRTDLNASPIESPVKP